jgi:hypothetical protein
MNTKKQIKFILDDENIDESHYAFEIPNQNIKIRLTNFDIIYNKEKYSTKEDYGNDPYIQLSIYIDNYNTYSFDEIKVQFLKFMNINSENVKDAEMGNSYWKFYKVTGYDWDLHKGIVAPIIENNYMIDLNCALSSYSTKDLKKLIKYRLKHE